MNTRRGPARCGQEGSAPVELAAGVVLLLLPVALLVATLPRWAEAHATARLAAREAARVAATEGDAAAASLGEDHAREILANRGFGDALRGLTVLVPGEQDGGVARHGVVVAEVHLEVWAPPIAGRALTVHARHHERLDGYRSLPP